MLPKQPHAQERTVCRYSPPCMDSERETTANYLGFGPIDCHLGAEPTPRRFRVNLALITPRIDGAPSSES